MLFSTGILYRIAFLAWGVAFLVLYLPGLVKHDIAVSLFGCVSFSETAFRQTLRIDKAAMLGFALGAPIFGILCDRLGRFRILLWTLLLAPCFSVLSGLAFSGNDFLFFRFLTGTFSAGLLISSAVLVLESRPPKHRAKAIICLLSGAATVPFLAFVLERIVCSVRFLPYADWRSFLILQFLAAGTFFYVRRYYDEPQSWKQEVRDKKLSEPTTFSFSSIARFPLPKLFLSFLFLFALIFGLRIIFFQSAEQVRQTAIRSFDQKSEKQFPIDAALLACMVRYPQLLGMKETDSLNLDEMPERFRNARRTKIDLRGYLAEAVLELHRHGEPINVVSLLDKAMEQKSLAEKTNRSTSEMPLYELDYYTKATNAYLKEGNRALNSMKQLPKNPTLTKAVLWQERLNVFKTLWNDLRVQNQQRYVFVLKQREIFSALFFIGGYITLWIFYFGGKTKSFRLPILCLLFFAMLLISSRPVSGVLQSFYFAPFLGITAFFLTRACLLTLPAFFKTPVRSTAFGIALMIACGIAYMALPDHSVSQHAPVKLSELVRKRG